VIATIDTKACSQCLGIHTHIHKDLQSTIIFLPLFLVLATPHSLETMHYFLTLQTVVSGGAGQTGVKARDVAIAASATGHGVSGAGRAVETHRAHTAHTRLPTRHDTRPVDHPTGSVATRSRSVRAKLAVVAAVARSSGRGQSLLTTVLATVTRRTLGIQVQAGHVAICAQGAGLPVHTGSSRTVVAFRALSDQVSTQAVPVQSTPLIAISFEIF
jgi:hypothetical protein